jgi:tetratricopeptide (TPR) repeat protein
MPRFGEYETIEQLSVAEEPHHFTTVWKGRRSGASDGSFYAVKCYAPRPDRIGTGQPKDAPEQDRALSFLDGIKRLKKAYYGEGGCVAPVHAFGLAPEGAWFATDFYERGTLKGYIDRQGRVDEEALRHVVRSVVTGCLALKRSCGGQSHGNLKPSNILLAGRQGPLRKSPLYLSDPYPGPLQMHGVQTANQRNAWELADPGMEIQDLRAIGELVLQLVEGRLLRGAYEYNYPVTRSERWDKLGHTGEMWQRLCNRLLDPRLSLEKESLEGLERELRPRAAQKKLRVTLAVLAGMFLVGVFAYFGMSGLGKLVKAHRAKREQDYRTATNTAWTTYGKKDYSQAMAQADRALLIHPEDAVTKQLKSDAQTRSLELVTASRREQDYRTATNTAWTAYGKKDYSQAMAEADRALLIHPEDAVTKQLKSDAQTRSQELVMATKREQDYRTATNAAWTAYGKKDYSRAMAGVDKALVIHPEDAVTKQLKSDAQRRSQELVMATKREPDYRTATNAAWTAYGKKDYNQAMAEADRALLIHPEDAVTKQLKSDAQARSQELVTATKREQDNQTATNAAWTAYGKEDYSQAMAEADKGLLLHPEDAVTKQLKSDAQMRSQGGQTARAETAQGCDLTRLYLIAGAKEDLLTRTVYTLPSSGSFGAKIGNLEDVALDLSTGRLLMALVSSGSDSSATPVPFGTFASATKQRIVLRADKKTFSSAPRFSRANWVEAIDAASADKVFRHFGQSLLDAGVQTRGLTSGTSLIGRHLVSEAAEPLGEVEDLMVDLPNGRVVFLVVKPITDLGPEKYRYVLPPTPVQSDTNGGPLVLKASRADFNNSVRVEKKFLRTQITETNLAEKVYQYYHQPAGS